MATIDVRVPHTAEHREIVAMLPEHFEIGRERVIASTLLREEMFRQQAEIVADAEEPAGLPARRGVRRGALHHAGNHRRHRIEQRQGKQDSRATKELAPRKSAPSGEVGCGHRLLSFVAHLWTAGNSDLFGKSRLSGRHVNLMAASPRILLIEDDANLAANLCLVLEDEGFAVLHASRGDEGLCRAGNATFAAVLT